MFDTDGYDEICTKLYSYDGISTILLLMMAVVPVATHPCLGKQVRHFRFIFTSREAQVENKQKMPKSPRTSTPGERKALRSKA